MTYVDSNTVDPPIYTIVRCLKELLVNQSIDDALKLIAEWLCESLDVDDCCIYERCTAGNSPRTRKVFRYHKQNTEDAASNNSNWQLFDTYNTPELKSLIERNQPLKATIHSEVSPELRILLEKSKIKSLLLIAVPNAYGIWGFISFADTKNIRTWRESEKELHALAPAIGAAIDTRRMGENLNRTNQVYGSTLSNQKEFVWELNLLTGIIKTTGSSNHIGIQKPGEHKTDVSKWLSENVHPEERERVIRKFESFLLKENGATEEDVYRVYNMETQTYAWILTERKLLRNEEGIALAITGCARDLSSTEEIAYEKNLNQVSTQLTHLINNIDDVYAIYDLKNAHFDFVSDNVETLYDCKKKAFLSQGLLWKELMHIEDAPGVEKEFEEIIHQKYKGEFFYRITTLNGESKMILEKITVGKDKQGNPDKLYIVKTDYTHIENAEQSLIETERKFRFISENISDFISIHDPDWHFTYASPSIRNILGYEPEEVLGLGGFDLVHPEDIIRALDDAVQPIVLERRETQLRYRMKAKDGEYKWVETYSKPIIDYKGETSSIISSTRDVTDQVTSENLLKTSVQEREKLLMELEQSLEKERELNELRSMFVSTASHQFRTPLTVIQSGVEIMEMYLDDLPGEKQERFQRQFNKIQTEVERLQYLMSDILLLGRANAARTPFQPQSLDLVEFCKKIIEDKYNHRYPDDRKVVFTVSGDAILVEFDPKLIGHAIENIISNAYKYSEEGSLQFQLIFTKQKVKLALSDNGIGIPDEELKNLFQPFYRATNTNDIEGTGLGLAIMKEFVDKHSGEIFVTSILNKGTTVNVILPITQNQR